MSHPVLSEQLRTEHICRGPIDVFYRGYLKSFEQMENCTVIEGYVQIRILPFKKTEQINEFTFPYLREITEYLLFYQANGLRSLGRLFPNLSVIGGQKLFKNYALIVNECPHLIEIGLHSLTRIRRGGVHIKGNTNLCYASSIDWSSLLDQTLISTYIRGNMKESDCRASYGSCPSDCPSAVLPVSEERCSERVSRLLCWNHKHCQIVCPGWCKNNACFVHSEIETVRGVRRNIRCCHEECLGGCSGPSPSDCFACLHIYHQGVCVNSCPAGLLAFEERRCVTDSDCRSMHRYRKDPNKYHTWISGNGTCVASSKVVCKGKTVDSMQEAQSLQGCTSISGALEITLAGGEELEEELESVLGAIEEVRDFIRVIYSPKLKSLSFFKSLKLIKGYRLYGDNISLYVRDNDNLKDIWDTSDPDRQGFEIRAGKVYFSGNSKLCEYKIREFTEYARVEQSLGIPEQSNGAEAVCEEKRYVLQVERISSDSVLFRWNGNTTTEGDTNYATVINYRKVKRGERVSLFKAQEEICSKDEAVWRVADVQFIVTDEGEVLSNLTQLLPYTDYVAYGQRYGLSSDTENYVTKLIYFSTSSGVPSSVRNLTVTSITSSTVTLSWSGPASSQGPLLGYLVMWQPIHLQPHVYRTRDYCIHKIRRRSVQENPGVNAVTTQGSSNQHHNMKPAAEKNQNSVSVTEANENSVVSVTEGLQYRADPQYRADLQIDCPKRKCCDCNEKKADVKPDLHEEFTRLTESPDRFLESLNSLSDETRHETGEREEYNVSGDLEEPHERWERDYISSNQTQITLTNLNHYQQYTIKIVACNERTNDTVKLCSYPAIIFIKTLHNAEYDSMNDTNITATVRSRDHKGLATVDFFWRSPSVVNGLIISYRLELRSSLNHQQRPMTFCISTQRYEKYNSSYSVAQLKPGKWIYRMSAESLARRGQWSPISYIDILEDIDDDRLPMAALVVLMMITVFCITLIISCSLIVACKKRSTIETFNLHYNYIDGVYTYIPDGWEIDRDDVTLLKPLGRGSFGQVQSGQLRDPQDPSNLIPVAIKIIDKDTPLANRITFMKEVTIMKSLRCAHVIRLYGVVSQSQPNLVIMELMANGDLKRFLIKKRHNSLDGQERRLSLSRTLQMAGEIADGMAYLASKKCVHRDLAARNCLISEHMVVKIADFGLARDMYSMEIRRKRKGALLAIRWMSPESLRDGLFTPKSDVWSYGVVLWEIGTMGEQPYHGHTHAEIFKLVTEGYTMSTPSNCHPVLSELMKACWHTLPQDRPTFEEIIGRLLPFLNDRFYSESYYNGRLDDSKCTVSTTV